MVNPFIVFVKFVHLIWYYNYVLYCFTGTSACNGDSGGGMYFPLKGSDGVDTWHLRGIVSVSVPAENGVTCDPYNYVVFTDVARYLNWIEQHLK